VSASLGEWLGSLAPLEPAERRLLVCAWAGRGVELDPDEAKGALRRAELLLAAGGDPHRAVELHGRAVTALAGDLDTPTAREQLTAGLRALRDEAGGSPAALEAVEELLADPALAWQCYAASLLVAGAE